MSTETLLAVDDLHVFYGASHVLHGVSLEAGTEPVAIVGRNGMGKTTLCKAVMGLVPARSGSIQVRGRAVTGLRPYQIARTGLGYVPQGRRVFPSLSVEEHLLLTARTRGRWTIERIYEIFPRLAERRSNGGGALSGGEQQMLAIARALLLNPSLLIMDEPTEGLAPVVVNQVTEILKAIRSEGVGLVLVEQNFAVATAVAERLLVMMNGTVALETTASALSRDEDLQRRYLGVSSHAH
ncbi:ABC transporter ATP-binding protein [Chelativorans sp. YIM 93263]|uniref:ABC transporter ATP-binding protein n=1 Tax=Chelativorans sp. YIM 93263 TaxID=2906648 RepID=UPI0023799922|nr:ABC transporter ATP-binding protein [Chelativorans sp. YIM 93263]